MPTATPRTPRTRDRLDPAVLKLAGVLVLGALAPLLDSTVVNVALYAVGHDLGASVATTQWVVTAYLLALAMTVPVSGWAVGRWGARRTWLTALALFLAGSVLCGSAWDAASLVGFRVLQGAGGGLMLPVLQTVLMRAAGRERLGRMMAVVTLPVLVVPILGPVFGGLIAGQLSWRWIFYVNVPVCAAALALAWRVLPRDAPAAGPRLDVPGLLLLSPGLAAVVYGLAQAGTRGFGRSWAPSACGVVLLACFVAWALRAREPLVELRLFRIRSFAASSVLLFLCGFAMFGPMLLLPLYYQQVRGESVVAAGLLLAPQGLGSLLARAAGGLIDRLGPRPVVLAGVTLTALGTLPFAVTGSPGPLLATALVVRGCGLSAATMAVMAGAYRDLEPSQIPDASTTTRITQQLGGSFGAAVLATVLARSGAPAPAFAHAFTWALACTALALLPALWLPRRES